MLSVTKSRLDGKTFLQTLFFFLLVTQICFAQWFWQNPLPQGNDLTSVKFISSDVGWAVGYGGTIIKTTNGGIKWTIQSNQTGYTLNSVSFTDENNGCAVGTMVIWNDSLWAHISVGIILNTTNGGTTWTEQISVTEQWLYGVYFTDANNGWAVGTEWDPNQGLILHTTNGGATWNKQTSGTTEDLFSVCFTDTNNGWVVGVTTLRTTDGGTTWIEQNGISGSAVCFTDVNNGWIVSGGGIILRTTNGGTTWTQQTSGTDYPLHSVSFTDANNGTVVGSQYIIPLHRFVGIVLRTTNGGTNWTIQLNETGYTLIGVSFSDANNGTVVGGGYPNFSLGTTILRTTNGGTNWNSQTSGTTTAGFQDVFFADANNGWVIGIDEFNNSGVILKTTNGGTTWSEQTIGTYLGLRGLFFTDLNNGWVVAISSPYGKIFHTTNGGTTWTSQTVTETNYLFDIAFSDENNGWIIGNANFRTTDGGTTWIEQYGLVLEGEAICFADANNGWVVGAQGKIFRTTNGGTDWIQQTSGTTNQLWDVSFTDVNNGWAVCTEYVDSLYINYGLILHTTNGGTTWTSSKTSGTSEGLQSVFFTDADNGWVGGGGGVDNLYGLILHTTDGGINWTRQINGTTGGLASIYFTDESNGWAVGGFGTILHTTNAGATFVEEEQITEVPTEFLLSQNYPNPLNPSTKIKYSIPQSSNVVIKVFDILGSEIETLVNEEKPAGTYEVNWNAANLSSGVYFYRLQAGDYTSVKKMILLK